MAQRAQEQSPHMSEQLHSLKLQRLLSSMAQQLPSLLHKLLLLKLAETLDTLIQLQLEQRLSLSWLLIQPEMLYLPLL